MIAHSLFKIFVSNLLLANWLRFLFGFLHPHTFSETLFSFQSTTSVLLFCKADSFYILSNHHFFVKNFFDLFFRLTQAFSAFTWRHLNILPAYLLLCKYFFSFYLFSFLTCLFLSSRRISRSDFINLPYFLRFGKSCSSFGFYVFLWNIYSDYSNYISRICFQL